MSLTVQKSPYLVNDKANPLNKYGLTKYLSEKHVIENANFGYIVGPHGYILKIMVTTFTEIF